MLRVGASTYNWSNCSDNNDCGERDNSTRGRRSASRPWGSNRLILVSSNAGIIPVEYALMDSTRTGTPKAWDAKRSSCGRSSPIRGTITRCKTPQDIASRNHAASKALNDQRATAALAFSSSDGAGLRSSIGCAG